MIMNTSNKFAKIQKDLIDLLHNNLFNSKNIFKYFSSIIDKNELLTIFKFLFGPGRDKRFLLHISNSDLQELANWLLTNNNNPCKADIIAALDFQENHILPFIKSHSATFLNTTSPNAFLLLKDIGDCNEFISSATINNEKYLSYTGDTRHHLKRFFLEACFYYNGKLTSFLNLIYEWNGLNILNFFSSNEETNKLRQLKCKINSIENFVTDTSPQILFPNNNTYIAINPLPSFSVLNSIKSEINNFNKVNYNKIDKTYKKSIFQQLVNISSSNPANPSTFNSDNNGKYNMFKNYLPIEEHILDINIFEDTKTLILNDVHYHIDPYDINKSILDFIQLSLKNIFYIRYHLNYFYEYIKKSKIDRKEKSYLYNKFPNKQLEYFLPKLWQNYKYILFIDPDYSMWHKQPHFLKETKEKFKQILDNTL